VLREEEKHGMIRLGVNVDHVATVREARKTNEPDPVAAAVFAELAGADLITVHLREDRRHIQERDLRLLKETVKLHLNLEMAATEEMVTIAATYRPDQVTLVPEKRQEVTTEGGLDVVGHQRLIATTIERLSAAGIPVSLFIDPDPRQVEASAAVRACAVEFHTGEYARAKGKTQQEEELRRIAEVARTGHDFGLEIHAGHGLTYQNVSALVEIPEIVELHIGHSIVARAILVGMERAVRDMLHLLGR
jgi:pyridoxine 5-phosphate synthase